MLMLSLGSVLLAYAGMLALCQGLDRHYKQVWGIPLKKSLRLVLRTVGWLGLGLSFVVCVAAWGWAMGPVGWFGAISVAGFVLVVLLPYAPKMAVYLTGAVPIWAVNGWLI